MKSDRRIAIIGTGLGGLSAALLLSHKGYSVDVYERLEGPGGKANQLWKGGFRFDMGPSLLTLPGIFSDLLEKVGEDIHDHLEFIRLDPITRYFFDDGTILDAHSDKVRFAEEIEEKLGEERNVVLRYLDKCKRTYEASTPLFMFKPLHETSTLASTDTIRAFFKTPKLDAFRTMHKVNSKWFKDKRTVQLFDRYATYNGSSPYLTPATFNLIQHVEYDKGGYAVKGGIHSIPRTFSELAEKRGASFHFNTEIETIVIKGTSVKGVMVSGKLMEYDAVISNSDVTSTYLNLLGDLKSGSSRKYQRLEPSSSGQVFYWGIRRTHDVLKDNNIFFSKDYKEEFDDIWNRRISPKDPTVYINITSRTEPDDAPSGKENWFVLVNVPYDSGQDWVSEREDVRRSVLKRLSKHIPDIEDDIEIEEHLGPSEIESRYGGNKGSIYGISSNTRASAFLRQPNRSRSTKGLFFAGGSAHPGGGMPLVVLSGIHAAELTERYLENGL